MVQLELTKIEQKIFKDVLEYDLSELHREIADTNNWELKEKLKEKEALLKKILGAVK